MLQAGLRCYPHTTGGAEPFLINMEGDKSCNRFNFVDQPSRTLEEADLEMHQQIRQQLTFFCRAVINILLSAVSLQQFQTLELL